MVAGAVVELLLVTAALISVSRGAVIAGGWIFPVLWPPIYGLIVGAGYMMALIHREYPFRTILPAVISNGVCGVLDVVYAIGANVAIIAFPLGAFVLAVALLAGALFGSPI